MDEDDRESVEIVTGPDLVQSGSRTVAMPGQRVDDDIQMLFGFEAGGRFEIVGFEGWACDGEEAARTLAFLQSDAIPMVEGLTFVSKGAQGVLPAATPGSLDGLWWGWNQGFAIGLDGIMAPTVEFRSLAFWPDGRLYDGTSPAALAPLDPAALAADTSWGTCREVAGGVELAFADGETERLTWKGEGLADGSRTLAEVEPLPDGAALDGTVPSQSYVALGPVGGAVPGGVASSSTTFRPDGSWEGTSMGVATGTFSDGAGGPITGGFTAGDDDRATRGAYEVRDGLLLMTPEGGGEPATSLAFVTPGGETLIGEQVLEAR